MTAKITGSFPKTGAEAYGAWAEYGDDKGQQTCVYVHREQGAVIGYYESLKDKRQECDLALSFLPTGVAVLQYHDAGGKVAHHELDPLIAGKEIQWFLESLKQRHIDEPPSTQE